MLTFVLALLYPNQAYYSYHKILQGLGLEKKPYSDINVLIMGSQGCVITGNCKRYDLIITGNATNEFLDFKFYLYPDNNGRTTLISQANSGIIGNFKVCSEELVLWTKDGNPPSKSNPFADAIRITPETYIDGSQFISIESEKAPKNFNLNLRTNIIPEFIGWSYAVNKLNMPCWSAEWKYEDTGRIIEKKTVSDNYNETYCGKGLLLMGKKKVCEEW